MKTSDIIMYVVIAIIVLVLIFLLLKEVICWYWKINKRVSLMEETNHLLRTYIASQNIAIPENIEASKVDANSNNIKEKIIENVLEDNNDKINAMKKELESNMAIVLKDNKDIIQLTKTQWEYYSDSDKYQMLYNNFTD
ncbi:MAG: hypothetical protein PHS38_09390 [Bacteroidales bacterium]|nr:hypothetical protein [Bacteroidales bacterium]